MMAGQAQELIDLVRQLQALEEGRIKLDLRIVSLESVCQEAVQVVNRHLLAKRIRVEVEVEQGLACLAEPISLRSSVLCNLLTNAVKFSYPGGRIRVVAEMVDHDWVALSVIDQGLGIPPKQLETLFDLEHQTSRPGTSGELGTGFGMVLLKRFVELSGGRVEVHSRDEAQDPDDHGTTVTVILRRPDANGE